MMLGMLSPWFFGILHLKDSFTFQSVKIPLVKFKAGKITRIKFEILDIYRGSKYRDTAITELLFSGTGVH